MKVKLSSRSGLTLLEVLISATMLVVMIGTVALTLKSGSRALQTGQTVASLETSARRHLDRISERLKLSSRENVTPDPESPFSSTQVDFQVSTGTVAGVTAWGDLERFELRYSATDPDDGADNDGNGLVDECEVVWVTNPDLLNESEQVLCTGVAEFLGGETLDGTDENGNGLIDERGLCFEFGDNSVTVRLTCQAREPGGLLIEATVQRTIAFRNQGDAP